METSRESLKRVVDLIKNHSVTKGMVSTEEEMAGKVGVPREQFYAYLNGQEEIPVDLPSRLKSAYGIKTSIIESVQLMDVHDPESPQDRSESNRESLKAVLFVIKKCGETKGMNITEDAMARKTGISTEKLYAYLNGQDETPDDLPSKLRSAYSDLLNSHQRENNRASLKGTVVLIRNRGLAEGMNITVEEMARKTGISGEELYAYLNDEKDVPLDDLSFILRSAYTDLLKNIEKVEIIEDIHMIRASGKSR